MSKLHGDRSRYNRLKKAKAVQRARMAELRLKIAAGANPAAAESKNTPSSETPAQ
jgi:hypothetical protein